MVCDTVYTLRRPDRFTWLSDKFRVSVGEEAGPVPELAGDYEGVSQAKAGIGKYLAFYNEQRPHSSLDGRTPDDVYFGSSSMLARAA